MSLNMTEIADLCGVCRQTVSAVLNGKKWVSAATRENVLRVVEEQGFHPNRLALQLQNQTTNMIGVVIRDLCNPFYMQMVQGICDVVQPAGLHLLLVDSHDDRTEEASAVSTMLSYRVRGIIMAPIQIADDHRHLMSVSKQTSFVTIGEVPGINSACVNIDDELAGALSAKYMLSHGHRHIGYMSGPSTQTHSPRRLAGFARVYQRATGGCEPLVKYPGTDSDEQVGMALELLKATPRPTGVVCYNDLLAISVYRAAQILKLRIPDDVSVIGCDDIMASGLLGPPLTTVVWPVRQIGRCAAEMLLAQQSSGRHSKKKNEGPVLFKPTIIERESVIKLVTQ